MHVMNCNTRRELVVVPAKVFIREYARDIYSCRRCERENTKVGIVKAPIPEPVIKGSAASASAIANIQESSWLNEGLSLSRQTMSNWLIKSASDWLLPLYEEMRTKMLKEDILHADGYSGYGKLDSAIRRCGCWAHARRKFHEGTMSIPAVERKN